MRIKQSVLVTRPGKAGVALRDAIIAAGGQAIHFPTLDIVPLQANPVHAEMMIVTSQYAALHAPDLVHAPLVVAIGPTTAQACVARGWSVAFCPPAGATTETLVDAAPLQDLQGRKVALLTGEGGRDLLASVLQARGAALQIVPVYRRVCRSEVAPLEAWTHISVVLCTSMDAFACLQTILGSESKRWLATRWIIAVSERIEEALYAQGFSRVVRARSAQTSAILDCLAAMKSSEF